MGRLITDIMREYRGGRLVNEMTEAIAQLTLKCLETGKGGKITLTFDMKVDGDEEDRQLELSADWTMKLPKLKLPSATYFADEEGNLTRTDPKQTEMVLSEVKGSRPKFPGVTGDQLKDQQSN